MATEEVADENGRQVRVALLDQFDLLLDEFLSVLQGELRKVVQDRDHLTGSHVVLPFQVVKESSEILGLAPE